jgi:hypothetical protein
MRIAGHLNNRGRSPGLVEERTNLVEDVFCDEEDFAYSNTAAARVPRGARGSVSKPSGR